jgi:hypothetical protein
MQNAANVAAASPVATGGVLWAPEGTALPTDATTALNAAFVALGYVGEDGLTPSGEAASSEDQVAWGGDVVATLDTSKSVGRYTFKLIEVFSQDVAEFVFGADNVTVTAAVGTTGTRIAIADNGQEPPRGVFVFDMIYRGKRMRRVLPVGQPRLTAEDALVHSALGGYEIEVTALPDNAGNRQYRYFEDDDAPGV